METSVQKAFCKPQGKTIPKEIQYVDHSLLMGVVRIDWLFWAKSVLGILKF
jgi:hypothetical protein